MDKVSSTYMNLSQEAAAQMILDNQGDCTGLNICLACPFVDECFKSIEHKAKFLNRDVRVRKAEEFLFAEVLELELDQLP